MQEPEHFRIDVSHAESLVMEHISGFASESVPLADAHRRVLCEDIVSDRDQPPCDRVTMDGIAADSKTIHGGQRCFSVAGIAAAGQPQTTLKNNGECIEVMTGAILPLGCDCIVPVERITRNEDSCTLEEGYEVEAGRFIHEQGSDNSKGTRVLASGDLVGAPEMAVLASVGCESVVVSKRPVVSIVSTGDELVSVSDSPAAHQIRRSNDRAIEAALVRQKIVERVYRDHLPDERDRLCVSLKATLADSDILIISGGVSMGRFDFVPGVLADLGVKAIFHKVTQRPGLPMWFGTADGGKLVFALPGNPVSALVCCVRYVIPAIYAAMGGRPPTECEPRLAETVEFKPELSLFLPVVLAKDKQGELCAFPRKTNTSGDLFALSGTDGFVELCKNESQFEKGTKARFFRW